MADHPIASADATDCPVVARFEVRLRRYIDADGGATGLPGFADDAELVAGLYEGLILTRAFDLKAVNLQRTGRLGTYAVSLGQEAVAVGTASVMRREDVLVPYYRDTGAILWRGTRLEDLLLFWGGDERGTTSDGPAHDFPISIPVGSHAPHAAGIAYAIKLRREPRVVVCMLGDGAMSKGDVWEAMNFAAIHKLPLVFVVNNNQWAISVPLHLQSATETLAQKGVAAGLRGEQVDGNDVIAVRATTAEAIEAARAGAGPSLVEALTYRLGDHTTADDASRYRSADEVRSRWKDDPIARLKAFLIARHGWSKRQEEELASACQIRVEAAAERYLAMPARAPASMFDHLYATLPDAYRAQRGELEGSSDD